jgi:hypothetical protein
VPLPALAAARGVSPQAAQQQKARALGRLRTLIAATPDGLQVYREG